MTPEDRVRGINQKVVALFELNAMMIEEKGEKRAKFDPMSFRYLFGFCYSMVKIRRDVPCVITIQYHRRKKDVRKSQ